jgi:hypothetical protein
VGPGFDPVRDTIVGSLEPGNTLKMIAIQTLGGFVPARDFAECPRSRPDRCWQVRKDARRTLDQAQPLRRIVLGQTRNGSEIGWLVAAGQC